MPSIAASDAPLAQSQLSASLQISERFYDSLKRLFVTTKPKEHARLRLGNAGNIWFLTVSSKKNIAPSLKRPI